MSDNRDFKIKVTSAPRANINCEEKVGECYVSIDRKHYYLVRDEDVLHVSEKCINTLFDNHITNGRHNRNEKYMPIKRDEFNKKLNEEIFAMNIFSKEFKGV